MSLYLQNVFYNKSEFIFNIWLMVWGQEAFAAGLQNQAKDTVTLSHPDKVTATEFIPERSFSWRGFMLPSKCGENLGC